MKRLLQAVLSLLLAPVVLAFGWAFFEKLGRTFGAFSGLAWLFVGAVAFALGHVLLSRTSLEAVFKPGWAEWFWRKSIRWRPAGREHTPPAREEEHAPPPAFLRVLPYCLPVVLILAVATLNIINLLQSFRGYREVFGFTCGFLLAEHLVWVGRYLKERNPNASAFGFSLTALLVLLVNIEVLAVVTWLSVRGFSLTSYNRAAVEKAAEFCQTLWRFVERIWR